MEVLSEKDRQEVIKYLEELTSNKIRPVKIKAIIVNPFNHKLPKMHIEVGKIYRNLEPDRPPEKILAIFEGKIFMVCTEQRGFKKGLPYFFVRQEVLNVEKYEE